MKRNQILYVRVTKENRAILRKFTKGLKPKASESKVIDVLIGSLLVSRQVKCALEKEILKAS